MRGKTKLLVLFACGWLVAAVCAAQPPAAQRPGEPDKEKVRRAESLAIARAAAGEYEIRVGEEKSPALELKREPVLRWSNPEIGDIYGNVFLWTRPAKDSAQRPAKDTAQRPAKDPAERPAKDPAQPQANNSGRPLVVGSLFHWFSERPWMEHELISLAEEPLAARFHGDQVWVTREAGVKFAPIPSAPAPAASEAQRFSQLKELAKQFTGLGIFRTSPGTLELRLLPQPIYRYAAAGGENLTGGLFAFVRATDPEILLVIEAGGTAGAARWHFAAVRMHSRAELWLEHGGQRVWEAEPLTLQEVFEQHQRSYTTFKFTEIPAFLKDAPSAATP